MKSVIRTKPSAVAVKPPTANEITADLLLEIPRRFPHINVWRNNRIDAMAMGRNGQQRRVSAGIDGQGDICGIIGQSMSLDIGRASAIESLRRLAERPGTAHEGEVARAMIAKLESKQVAVVCLGGRMLQVEVKAGRDSMRPSQLAFKAMIERHNGVYIVARSVEQCLKDLEEICEVRS